MLRGVAMMELFPDVLYLGFHSTSKYSGYASPCPGALQLQRPLFLFPLIIFC